MNNSDAKRITDWLIQKSNEVPYGELLITVKLHVGKPPLIEKTITERERATGLAGAGHEHKG